MSGLVEWQMDPELAAGLERLGWQAAEPAVREAVPAVLRGGNVVAVLPPGPAWAAPVLAAALSRTKAAERRVLLLAAPAMVRECGVTLGALVESASISVEIARDVVPAPVKPNPHHADVLVASPASALDRHMRSALAPERVGTIVFAWPEDWAADEAIAALLQDLPRDAQRIVLTARPDTIDGTDGVVERYARKAIVISGRVARNVPGEVRPALSIRTVATSWLARAETVAAVRELLDPARLTVWTADDRDHALIRRTAGGSANGVSVSTRAIPEAGLVVCYDPPGAADLADLVAKGEVVLLVVPGSERHLAAIATTRRPLQLNAPESAQRNRDAALRQEITSAIEAGEDAGALYALGPLFEQFDPQLVASALFGLWRRAPNESDRRTAPGRPAAGTGAVRAEAEAASPGTAPPAKIWIGAGKKDEATVGDFVAVLIREAGMERSQIGRIELRDTFALVEVPATDAQTIVERLTGMTIRKRKLSARVDRGRGGGGSKR